MTTKKTDAFNAKIKIPFFVPSITNQDKAAIRNALNSSLLTDGPKLREFEFAFAKMTGAKFAIGVSNATSALHLSLRAMKIGSGDEVIVPDMTFVATASSVLLTGATPVFADIELDDMNISVDSIKKNLTSKTKAILPVHFAGKACKMKEIMKIARSENLLVIEDCAHAIGTKSDGMHVGTFGDVGCFSFYPTKNITTIEGGMVITNSEKIAENIETLRNHGITRSLRQRFAAGKPWDYDVKEPGYNYRLDEIRSSLGISQLKRLNQLNLKRKKVCEYYNDKLGAIDGITTPKSSIKHDNSYHLYMIRVKKRGGVSRDNLFKKLLSQGIRTTVHYKPLHRFTAFKKRGKIYDRLDNTNKIFEEILSLPLYPEISRNEQDYVIDGIKKYVSKN